MIKKFSQRCFKSKNHHVSVIFQELIDLFIIFFLNNTNELIENNKNKESKAEKLNTIILFSKIFIFFEKFKQAKNRFNIKIDNENFVFFHFYDRKLFEKDLHQIIFVNKEKFLIKVKVNFEVIFDDIKNITIYF